MVPILISNHSLTNHNSFRNIAWNKANICYQILNLTNIITSHHQNYCYLLILYHLLQLNICHSSFSPLQISNICVLDSFSNKTICNTDSSKKNKTDKWWQSQRYDKFVEERIWTYENDRNLSLRQPINRGKGWIFSTRSAISTVRESEPEQLLGIC
jgi:hypothetical protein